MRMANRLTSFKLIAVDALLVLWLLSVLTPSSFAQQESGLRTAGSGRPELYVQTGHAGNIISIAFSPDGKLLASSGGSDETVKLWDVMTGEELRTFAKYGAAGSFSLTFSPDSQILAGYNGDDVVLWDVITGSKLRSLKVGEAVFGFSALSFSPVGRRLAVGTKSDIQLWDVSTGRQLLSFSQSKNNSDPVVGSIAFSPDGKVLASVSADQGGVTLWDASTGAKIRTLVMQADEIYLVTFSSDGKTLIGSDKGTIKYWDISNGTEIKVLAQPDLQKFQKISLVYGAIRFSLDREILAFSGKAGGIDIIDVKTGNKLRELTGDSWASLALSPDNRTLASANGKSIKLWDVTNGSEIRTLKGHASDIWSTSFSPDGNILAVVNGDDNVMLWEMKSDRELHILNGASSRPLSVAFSPDGRILAAGGKSIKLWDVSSGRELHTLSLHGSTEFLAFGHDGKTLAAIDDFKVIRRWDIKTGLELNPISGGFDGVALACSPDSKTIAVAGNDFAVRIFDVASGTEIRKMTRGISTQFSAVAFSPDGKTLASGSHDNTVEVWDVSDGRLLNVFEGHSHWVDSIAYSPDGKTLASGSYDKTVKLWNVDTGKEILTLTGHAAAIGSVQFDPSGHTLATGSQDGRVNLWDLRGGNKLATLIALDKKDWVVITPDGRFDGSPDGMKLISYRQDNKILPLDSFFEQFYTPKLLQRVYAREPLPSPTAKVDFSKQIKLPPLVRIASPKPGATSDSDEAQIVVEASDQGGGIEDIRLYQNGKLVSDDTRQLTRDPGAKSKTFDVTLLPGINTFRATAFNSDRTEATPDEIKIELKAVEASSSLYILAIGLNEYKNTRYNLNYGHADAQAVADAVEHHGRGIFKEIRKRVIFDADATRANIEAAFTEIIKQAKPQDAFVFYYAGHGVMSESDDKNPADFYLVPYEVVRIYGDDGSLTTSGIAARNLRELLKNVRAQKQLIILDACESGGAVETIAMRGASEEKAIMQLARSAGVAVLASAGQDQVATEFGKLGHGVFTYALLKGLSGEADGSPKDGKVTIKELEAYINDQVPELTKLYRGKRQDPNSWTRGQDFPIAVMR